VVGVPGSSQLKNSACCKAAPEFRQTNAPLVEIRGAFAMGELCGGGVRRWNERLGVRAALGDDAVALVRNGACRTANDGRDDCT